VTSESTLQRVVAHAQARLKEFVPTPQERRATPPVKGALRMMQAGLGQLRASSAETVVVLDGGGRVGVDLGTPHGRRIFAYGFCEPASRAMRSLLSPGDVAIDAGANIGLFTVLAAARVGAAGRVVACEPSPSTMAILRANVERNRFDWVTLREVALAEAPGRLELEVFDPGSGFSSFAPAASGSGTRVEVEVTTLDALAGDLVDRVKLVKIDVEGAELRALEGASRLLSKARPDFIVELEPEHLERQGSSLEAVQALFAEAAYVGYEIGEQGFKPLHGTWHRPAGDPNVVVRPRERS
jgi:FkbM family methyltransferase